jgi:hypothetical protein
MNVSEYGTSENVDPLMREFEAYGLFRHVVELEAYGVRVAAKIGRSRAAGYNAVLAAAILPPRARAARRAPHAGGAAR